MNTPCVRRTHSTALPGLLVLLALMLPALMLPALMLPCGTGTLHAQTGSIALLADRAPERPEGSVVTVVTTTRAIVRGVAVHASPQGMLVWVTSRPFSHDALTANTTFVRAADILAIQFEQETSTWSGVLTGAAVGAAGLALPIVIAGLTSGSDVGIQGGDVLLAAAVGGVAGGVVGGLLAGGKHQVVTLDVGASAERFGGLLSEVRPLCMYAVSAPDDVVRAMRPH